MTGLTPPPPRSAPVLQPTGDFSQVWSGWFRNLYNFFKQNGYSGTITTAKLTSGGTNGSLTFTNGVLTGQVPPT